MSVLLDNVQALDLAESGDEDVARYVERQSKLFFYHFSS
jgi:hypothetical protein